MSFRPTGDQRSEAVVPVPTPARERSDPDTTWRFNVADGSSFDGAGGGPEIDSTDRQYSPSP